MFLILLLGCEHPWHAWRKHILNNLYAMPKKRRLISKFSLI